MIENNIIGRIIITVFKLSYKAVINTEWPSYPTPWYIHNEQDPTPQVLGHPGLLLLQPQCLGTGSNLIVF